MTTALALEVQTSNSDNNSKSVNSVRNSSSVTSDRNNALAIPDTNSQRPSNRNLEALREKVKLHEKPLRAYRVDPETIRVRDGVLDLGDRRLGLAEHGFDQLAVQAGAPVNYLKQLEESLAYQCLNHHLSHGHHIPRWPKDTPQKDRRLVAFARDEEFRGFRRVDLATLSGTEVFDAVSDALDAHRLADSTEGKITISANETWQLDLVTDQRNIEIRPNDIIKAGLRVTHCPFGSSATTVQAFWVRLVCTNGWIHRECGRQRSIRIRRLPRRERDAVDKVRAQVRRLADSTLSGLVRKLESIRTLKEERISQGRPSANPREAREHFLHRLLAQVARLRSRRLIEGLLDVWEEGDDTAYGAMNAMTFLATHNPNGTVAPGVRLALERLAGVMATRSIHICPQCYSMIPD